MTDLPEALITYLATREEQRSQAVQDFLARLTPRERALVHDVAVMGYVQGLRHSREDGVPADSETIRLVVDACFAFPDQYPAVNAIARTKPAPDPTWTIETQQQGTWRRWLGDRDDQQEAQAAYADAVAHGGDRWAFRLVRTDSTRLIEAQHTPEEPS